MCLGNKNLAVKLVVYFVYCIFFLILLKNGIIKCALMQETEDLLKPAREKHTFFGN